MSPQPTQLSQPPYRVDGKQKVTGTAKYAAEFPVENLAYAVMVVSSIPNGQISGIDTARAEQASGVLAVITPANALKLPDGGKAAINPPGGRTLSLLQDNLVHYNGQPIAMVVARTLEEAQEGSRLLQVHYKEEPARLDIQKYLSESHPPKAGREPARQERGDIDGALARAEVKVEETYTTPVQNHNPMEPHATIAEWTGNKLSLYDATQYISGVRQSIAKTYGIPLDDVRVQCPFTGGGFGSKGSMWSHVALATMAAKMVNRPVQLVVGREQMFGPVGSRPLTIQKITLAATKDGHLTAQRHEVLCHGSVMEDFLEPSANQTRMLYNSDANLTSAAIVSLNLGVATFQRAPGEATGTYALESAMDELAYKLNMDPIALRMKNYAERDPGADKPFSSKTSARML